MFVPCLCTVPSTLCIGRLYLQPLRQPQHEQYTRTRMLELRDYETRKRGITSSSPEFNPSWNQASIHMVICFKTFLTVAAPTPSESGMPSSPSKRNANNGYSTGTVQDEPDSPSRRNDRDEPASYRYICLLSPSGRMEHDDY